MTQWRFLQGWSDGEIGALLQRARQKNPNFDPDGPLDLESGWDWVRSRALVAWEPPGPPQDGGAFETLWHAVQRFHHSDPRIVTVHFRDAAPLERRHLLLELQALGLRYLCPARIGAVRDEANEDRTLRGFAIDTLEGHIERGREWFLLLKDHHTGEVRFRIEARWRPGDFPNEWSRLGFHLVGRRYQRAWHRLAHLRLRRIAAGQIPPEVVSPDGIAHERHRMPDEPVQLVALRGHGRRKLRPEQEDDEMGRHRFWRAMGLAALAGVRSATPPALVLVERSRRRGPISLPAGLAAAAAGTELVVDKLPFVPARVEPAGLVARALSGAFVAATVAGRRDPRLAFALAGAATAVAAAFLSHRLRSLAIRRSPRLGYAAAVAEDTLAVTAGARLAAGA